MHLAERLRILLDQRADAARLRAGKILAHDATGREPYRKRIVHHLRRRPVAHRVELRLAGLGVEAAALVEARRPGMPVSRTGPEYAALVDHALPADAGVVGRPAVGSDPHLIKHLLGRGVWKVALL